MTASIAACPLFSPKNHDKLNPNKEIKEHELEAVDDSFLHQVSSSIFQSLFLKLEKIDVENREACLIEKIIKLGVFLLNPCVVRKSSSKYLYGFLFAGLTIEYSINWVKIMQGLFC